MKRYLLVEPDFPIPPKSKNHKDFLPIGLLKIATYLRGLGHEIKLVRGTPKNLEKVNEVVNFAPEEVWVTSLFTYWAEYVREAVMTYKTLLPNAKVVVGGIYASLFPKEKVKSYTGCDDVYQGVIPEVEDYIKEHPPAYDLLEEENGHSIDYQIIHTSRGCPRKCPFCGTWKIEPEFVPKRTIFREIVRRKVVIYDNNFLMNPYVEDILEELIDLKKKRKLLWVESQSGFDGRVLLKKPHLARMLKEAGFRYPRIAWDWEYEQWEFIEQQLRLFVEAGYKSKEISVFMLYNWDIPFEEMEKKRIKCWEWQVQISDCRYRPLNQLYDHYNPNKLGQTIKDYYIHESGGWSDILIKQFRKNVRRQNICVRHGFPYYSAQLERKKVDAEIVRKFKNAEELRKKFSLLRKENIEFWIPNKITYPGERELR